ncbi:NERD domain-containing protein [Shimazuella sp. AN120528]|uniref:nuclease-related domain-containing DEAD/DEAH box helicase n=1 Tax=Shimazuella soli TaxID=1892854 RepID=UPI001F0E405A|nr:NERD domain-containing protein [Shimazuella soli]MCH5586367.1 NERD domain-containing protein [Shimazuella soli]
MIPPFISPDVKSRGEKEIFSLLEQEPDTENWIVLHSLSLSKHIRQMFGEIDFLVMAPKYGLFCLEVKSGGVVKQNGIWKYTNRYGKTFESIKGPFEQAKDGMYSLREAIRNKFGPSHRLSKLILSFGVVFPHISYPTQGPEEDQWRVYDRESRRQPFSKYIERLSRHTVQELERKVSPSAKDFLPTENDVQQLVRFLRGDFERLVSTKVVVEETEQDLLRLTEEQYQCLDLLQHNKRCLFEGAAGTGKTLIATESARRAGYCKKQTLFLCYNQLLASHLKQTLHDQPNVVVSSFHAFLLSLSKKYIGLGDQKNPNFFTETLPTLALEALGDGELEPFDKLVLDEGQDLIREDYLDVLDSLLRGGLAGGEWEIFSDFHRQNLFSDYTRDEMIQLIRDRSDDRFTSFMLTKNCRNTRNIGLQTYLLSGFDHSSIKLGEVEGENVRYYFYKNQEEQQELIQRILSDLRRKKIPSEKITLLSSHSLDRSVGSYFYQLGKLYDLTDGFVSQEQKQEKSQFCTIQSFKGMENSYVLITDINNLHQSYSQSHLYVGMSRAKVGLILFLEEGMRDRFNELIAKGMSR